MRFAVGACILALITIGGLPLFAQEPTASEPASLSPLGGSDREGKDFRLLFPTGRLVSLQVNVGRWQVLPIQVVKGIKVVAENAMGKRLEEQAGPCDGKWQEPVAVPPGTELIGVSGRAGQVLDSVGFHFSDGKSSPLFGGTGGDAYQVVLRRQDGMVRGSVRGLYGKATGDSVRAVGLVLTGRNGKPAELASPDAGLTLTIRGEVSPEMAPLVGHLTALYYQCYPTLLERFDHPKKPASRHITLVLKRGLRVPAYCTGAEITVNIDWLRRHPTDIALLTHELTHAVQAYPVAEPQWLSEGIADYARQVYGPKEQPDWSLPARLSPKQSYKDGYRVAARFLQWLDAQHPGVLDKVHRRLQDRAFSLDDFRTLTGKSIDTLWQECVRDLDKK